MPGFQEENKIFGFLLGLFEIFCSKFVLEALLNKTKQTSIKKTKPNQQFHPLPRKPQQQREKTPEN